MGRTPIGRQPLTPAEKQQRYRDRQKRLALWGAFSRACRENGLSDELAAKILDRYLVLQARRRRAPDTTRSRRSSPR
jgi:hypothetical protein